MGEETLTTELDATLDLLAALEMYAGTFGSESTTIEDVTDASDGTRHALHVRVSNGDVFELRVRAV